MTSHYLKQVYNNHAQYITDFDLIYEDNKEIKLYILGTLHTKPKEDSHNICNEKNYKGEEKTQQLKFHEFLIPVKNNLHIVKNSAQYFEAQQIKQNIENTAEYKKLFDQVLVELKEKGIKVKVATTPEEFPLTGFNVLLKKYKISEDNNLYNVLPLNNDGKSN